MTRRDVPLDAVRILRALSDRDVAYVVIGGLAVQAHGHTRTTQDVDIVPDPDPDNLRHLADALGMLRARPAGQDEAWSASQLTRALLSGDVLALDTEVGGVDVHPHPPGAAPYDELRARALLIDVAEVTVAIAGRDDLIAMKRASGRPIDRGDVIALTVPERER